MQRQQIVFDVFRLAEPVSFTFVKLEDMGNVQPVQQSFGLFPRDDHIPIPLEDRQRDPDLFGVLKRGPCIVYVFLFRQRARQALRIMQFQLPGAPCKAEQI